MHCLIYACLLVLVRPQDIEQPKKPVPVNLLLLGKHYALHGNAIHYTGYLKLLSNKLKNQVSLVTSVAPMKGGGNWTLDL